MSDFCPCGSEKNYYSCCGAFIDSDSLPQTPEELMRSRYTAYTQANVNYIARTMKSPAADRFNPEAARDWAKQVDWLKLEVLSASMDGSKGLVEFIAYFAQNDKKHIIHELSLFHLENGAWYYVDGQAPRQIPTQIPVTRISRNTACLCGSGKKYKRCCGSNT